MRGLECVMLKSMDRANGDMETSAMATPKREFWVADIRIISGRLFLHTHTHTLMAQRCSG